MNRHADSTGRGRKGVRRHGHPCPARLLNGHTPAGKVGIARLLGRLDTTQLALEGASA